MLCYDNVYTVRLFVISTPCYIFHYKNAPMLYTDVSLVVKIENFHWKHFDIFKISAQNIHCGYTLKAEAVLTSTNNVYLG